jgi:large subunit ribosomal protein L29
MPTKLKDYRGMSGEQLGLTLRDTEKHLFQLRFQSATDRLETPSEIRKAKKEIARIRTIQRERELAELAALAPAQLAPKIAALEAKDADGGPGKRTVRRKLRRLQGWHAEKVAAATPKPQPKPSARRARTTAAQKGAK